MRTSYQVKKKKKGGDIQIDFLDRSNLFDFINQKHR